MSIHEIRKLLNFSSCGYNIRWRTSDGKDEAGKRQAKYNTVREPLADASLLGHFQGKQAISVQPILDTGNTVQWGCIDIDDYNDPDLLETVRKKAALWKIPCYLEKSKSDGVHLYIFLNQPVVVPPFRKALRKIAIWLGFPKAEIRPVQDMVDFAGGDTGTMIVVPGFGKGVEGFLAAYKSALCDVKVFNDLTDEGDFADAPACLFPLHRLGEAQGFSSKNLYLYQLAVYYRYKFPVDWAERVRSYNDDVLTGSNGEKLESREVEALIKQLSGNSKCHYRCNGEPFEDVCNKTQCQFRRFGVAARESADSIINPEGITVLDTDPPIWFVTLTDPKTAESVRVKLSTDELLTVAKFKKRCLETIQVIPTLPKQKDWEALVSKLLESATYMPVPFDMTEEARLQDAVVRFCLTSCKSSKADDLLRGRVWMEPLEGGGVLAHFRQVDLINYLGVHRIGGVKMSDVHSTMNDLCKRELLTIEKIDLGGVAVTVYKVAIASRYLELQALIEEEKEAS